MGLLRRVRSSIGVGILALATIAGATIQANSRLNRAIDKGTEYLLAQAVTGERDPACEPNYQVGQCALETYALIVAGVSIKHPVIDRNFEFLSREVRRTDRKVYAVSLYLMALDAAISQIEEDLTILRPSKRRAIRVDDPRVGRSYRKLMADGARILMKAENGNGAWHYNGGPGWDNSNTQFAVLALGVCQKRGVAFDEEVWVRIANHFLKWQQTEGKKVDGRITLAEEEASDHEVTVRGTGASSRGRTGRAKGGTDIASPDPVVGTEHEVFARAFPYGKDGYRWSMTCAGQSSLLLCRRYLQGRIGSDLQTALNKGIRDGYGWIMSHWNPNENFYGQYSLEKVADIGGVEKFAGNDWYEIVSSKILGDQKDDGRWEGNGHSKRPRCGTSFALLILNRATSLLTRAPANRIVVSGKSGSVEGGIEDRSWVYVPSLNATMHFPTLLRTIRMRPTEELIRFLRNIIDNYQIEWKGELIPEMAKIRDSIENRAARRIIDGYLEDITGADYREWEKYLVWHRRWERVMAIGKDQAKERVPDLLKYYRNTNRSIALKRSIVWALLRCKAREAIPFFLDDLEHDDAEIRATAYDAYRQFFVDFPPKFDARGSSKERAEQVEAIRAWNLKQQS